MKDNLDTHIDSKIKNSFESLQSKAPVHLWDTISEQMDTEQTLDDVLDKKVEESYLNQADKTAPAFLWSSIAKDLDADANLNNALDDKLKKSFDKQLNKSAPAFLWGSITEGLNQGEKTLDQTLDDKLKESYNTEGAAKTPNSVWFAINRQLNIDKTWNKISRVLEATPVVSDWRKPMLRFMAAASLMLLFVKTCDFNPQPLLTDYTTPSSERVVENKNHQNNISKPLNKADLGNSNKVNNNSNNNNSNNNNSNNNSGQATNNNRANNKSTPTLGKKVTNSSSNPSTNTNKDGEEKGKNNIVGLIAFNASGNKLPKGDINSGNQIDKRPKGNNIASKNNKGATIATSPIEEAKEQINSSLKDLVALNVADIPFDNKIEPIRLLDELALEKKTKKNLIAGKLEVGAFVVVNSTMLLNNQTREGFDKNSLVQNYFGLAANYGLWASYKIIPKGAIVAEFSINADNRQAYGIYHKGVYYVEEWVMKYNRVSLAYKHDLWVSKGKDKVVNTKLVAQGGIYLGFLREAKLFYDGDLVYDFVEDHNQFDFGFKVALGQEISIDKFVVGFGLRSDIGVTNIFRGNANITAQENHTNVIQLGGYVTIGYKF